jgi:D-arginine dehydrogenase
VTTALSADVLVIGAGIAGASVAAELAARRRVVLLEMEDQPGYHATGRSAAVFAECYGNRTVRGLTRASRAHLESTAGPSGEPLLSPRGWMFVARPDQLAQLAALRRELDANGATLRLLDPAQALERVPILRREWLAGALLDEGAMDIDVHALQDGYLRRLRAAGGKLVTGAPVTSLERASGARRVRTGRGDHVAPLVIDAAGAWAEEIGRRAGAMAIGLVPMRRTAVILDPPAGVAVARWPMVVDAGEEFYFKPDAGKLLASPADETPSEPCDAHPEELDVAIAVDRITRACHLEVHHLGRRWAGLRSFVPDRTPVAGFDPRAQDFFWLAGQGGYGIQTAPALARLATAGILGEPIPADIEAQGVTFEALSPARLAR